ncbi:MAG: zinc-binding dehydrogenase [Oscillospiraceae bacterium]|nr:zinc-binding dehydrogenase [Oscillospiraceae bacterium]
MKALMKLRPGRDGMGLQDMPIPEAGENEVVIKVAYAGICGTDLHIRSDEYEANAPVIMGHEFSGTIHQVGAGVLGYAVGDPVVSLTAVVTCGHCRYCLSGTPMLCSERKSIGSGVNGAFAQYMVVPARTLYPIPEGVSLKAAALCEPLACCVRSVSEVCRIDAGDIVLVSGPGAIGLLALQVARANGAKVYVSGTSADEPRLRLAMQLGAAGTITVNRESLAEAAEKITGGAGFDAVFECAGVAASADGCLKVVRKGGRFGQIGLFGKAIPFDLDLLLKKEVKLSAGFATTPDSWRTALRLLEAGTVDTLPIVSDIFPLESWETAFDKMEHKMGLKILFSLSQQN